MFTWRRRPHDGGLTTACAGHLRSAFVDSLNNAAGVVAPLSPCQLWSSNTCLGTIVNDTAFAAYICIRAYIYACTSERDMRRKRKDWDTPILPPSRRQSHTACLFVARVATVFAWMCAVCSTTCRGGAPAPLRDRWREAGMFDPTDDDRGQVLDFPRQVRGRAHASQVSPCTLDAPC